jgi:DNA-binding MarR family transcriptional regulator
MAGMTQLGLELPLRALVRCRDPATSRAAAARLDVTPLMQRVLDELAKGPGTAHELAERTGLSLVTVSPRMKPLEGLGRVERAGTRNGRTIWRKREG